MQRYSLGEIRYFFCNNSKTIKIYPPNLKTEIIPGIEGGCPLVYILIALVIFDAISLSNDINITFKC